MVYTLIVLAGALLYLAHMYSWKKLKFPVKVDLPVTLRVWKKQNPDSWKKWYHLSLLRSLWAPLTWLGKPSSSFLISLLTSAKWKLAHCPALPRHGYLPRCSFWVWGAHDLPYMTMLRQWSFSRDERGHGEGCHDVIPCLISNTSWHWPHKWGCCS